SVAPEVPPVSATCQCPSVPHQCHPSVPVSATYQCQSVNLSVLRISDSQCRLSVRISASQCRLSVPYISVMYQCCLSVPISDACQCPSVQPTSASSSV
ncbi:unnamed protein product, partial [Staurois parvus]